MVFMKFTILICCCLILMGCAHEPPNPYRTQTSGHIKGGASAALKIGMTKEEVLALYGLPRSAAGEPGKETLFYTEEMPWWNWKRLRITLVDGKVSQYGQD